jgi:hypothetical protein
MISILNGSVSRIRAGFATWHGYEIDSDMEMMGIWKIL